MDGIFLTIAILIFLVGFATLFKRKKIEQRKITIQKLNIQKSDKELKKRGFVTHDISKFEKNILAWDKNNQKISLIIFSNYEYEALIFDYKSIRDAEVIKDGEIIFKKSTMSIFGGAIIGGVLLGGVGSIIGGLTGDSKSKERINSLSLKIYFNSIDNPSETIEFINETTLSEDRIKLIKEAEKWKDRLIAIIDYEKTEDKKATTSNADELKKYKELLDTGAITEAEYNSQKTKLLGL